MPSAWSLLRPAITLVMAVLVLIQPFGAAIAAAPTSVEPSSASSSAPATADPSPSQESTSESAPSASSGNTSETPAPGADESDAPKGDAPQGEPKQDAQKPDADEPVGKATDQSGEKSEKAPEKQATTAGPQALALEDSEVGITKETNVATGQLAPGDEFIYTIVVRCSGLEAGCVNQTVTDTLPAGLDVTSLPGSTSTREVDYDPATRLLTVTFTEELQAPIGAHGLNDGRQVTLDIGMRLPLNTTFETGHSIRNTAVTDADNATEKQDHADVEVTIPRSPQPIATKRWDDGAAVAQSGEESTIRLGVRNGSTGGVRVSRLIVTDATPGTFDHFDLTAVRATAWPAGADRAVLEVCTQPGSACDDGDYQAGAVASQLGALVLPAGVAPSTVTGFRVAFYAADGSSLPYDATGGTVEADLVLRDTVRSTGAALVPTERQRVRNTATPSLVEDGDTLEGDEVAATYDILPELIVVTPQKNFFADTNGNFTRDTGEHAVLGHNSGVSATVGLKNDSAFELREIRIVEPDAGAPAHEFDKIDVSKIRLRFPAGATQAVVKVTYDDGQVVDHPATGAPALTNNQQIDVTRAGHQVRSIEVVYTGVGQDGRPSIAVGSTAWLDLHGTLTDDVDAEDLPGGTSPGIHNVASYTAQGHTSNSTGTASGTVQGTLQIESERVGNGDGVKNVGQGSIPADQPIPFTLRITNNGNIGMVNPVLSDPQIDGAGRPVTADNPFSVLRLVSATVRKDSGTPNTSIQVFDPTADAWVAYAGGDTALLTRATGVRVLVDGVLTPTKRVFLDLVTERRPGIPDDVELRNCFVLNGDNMPGGNPVCSPVLETGAAYDGAVINKALTPSAGLVEQVPGVGQQTATADLTVVNTSNVNATRLVLEDVDADFFDAMDLGRVHSLRFPAGADRARIDVLIGGTWHEGTSTAQLAATATYPLPLPAGVDVDQVTGVRVTFTHSSGEPRIRPCVAPYAVDCSGIVKLALHPRETLRSDSETPIPTRLENTLTGGYETALQPEGRLVPVDPVDADLEFVSGTARLDVDKAPNTAISPGETAPFRLTVTNNGTSNLPGLVVRDLLPPGLEFNESFAGDGGEPFRIVDAQVPAGTDPVPTPTFTPARNGDRITGLAWDFGDWIFRPGATFVIEIEVTLAPGVAEGEVHRNLMGATTSHPDFACTAPDGTENDGAFGPGRYCTDGAEVTTKAGAAFAARKWVAGTPALGWHNGRTGQLVPVGDTSCPVRVEDGVSYTAHPCVAMVNPGDEYRYLMSMVNAGTEPATQMRIIDRFPVQGDKGVVLSNSDRRTEWDRRPVLASAPVLHGRGSMTTSYADSEAELCTADLQMGNDCGAGTWSGSFGPQAVGMQLRVEWAQPLAPGEGVTIGFTMTSPLEVTEVSNPTVAWNSFGHAEITERSNGQLRTLPPVEPIKVGIAMAYGGFEVTKQIGANPGNLPVGDKTYEFAYRCMIQPVGATEPFEVASGTLPVVGGATGAVSGIPAGAECSVWETESHGGVSSHPQSAPATLTITPQLGTDPVASVTVTNSFPLADLDITKVVDGAAAEFGDDTTYPIEVRCTMDGVAAAGFPRTVDVTGNTTETISAPVGALCTAVESNDGGATSTEITPAGGVQIVPGANAGLEIEVTNAFDAGGLRIQKLVTGAGAQLPEGPFEFSTRCTFEGESFGPFVTVLQRSGQQTTLAADVDALLPIGAECVVTETDNGGADQTPDPVTVTITANNGDPVLATFTNRFSAGIVTLEKTLAGAGATADYATGAVFTVDVTCAVGAAENVVFSRAVEIKGGELITLADAQDEPIRLPLGTHCWAAESATGGATSTTIAADSFDNAVVVTAGSPDDLQTLALEVENTFDLTELALTKKVDGAAAHYAAGREYQVAVTCVLPQDGTEFELFANRMVTLTAGQTQVIEDLPVGARCWAAETEKGGATHSVVSAPDQVSPVALVAGETVAITVTNTFEAGELTVTKRVVGQGSGPFSFTLACTTDRGPVTLAAGDAAFTLAADETRRFVVPLGAECQVTEVNVPKKVEVSYADSDGVADGKVVVAGSASVTVTNTFADEESKNVTDDDDQQPQSTSKLQDQGPKGWLPNTGGTPFWLTMAGLVILGVGLVLAGVSRRRRS